MTSRRDASREDDDYDDIPLQYQRPFGTGLHKKPIAFVAASSSTSTQTTTTKSNTGAAVADLYLSMVLPDDAAASTASRSKSAPPSTSTSTTTPTTTPTTTTTTTTTVVTTTATAAAATAPSPSSEPTPSSTTQTPEPCPVCNLPLPPDPSDPAALAAHNRSLAHQLCLPHSPPPSALDRTRMGLAYLSAHGWDPDSRRGLGAEEQGLRFPLKPRVREERLGLGAPSSSSSSSSASGAAASVAMGLLRGGKGREKEGEKERGPVKLDAKKVRKMAVEERRRKEEIRNELFGDGRLEKYLGVAARHGSTSAPGSRSASRSRGLGT